VLCLNVRVYVIEHAGSAHCDAGVSVRARLTCNDHPGAL